MADDFFFDFESGGHKAYVPYPRDTFEKGMRTCFDNGFISRGAVFLDLGAGKGRIVREAAHLGLRAYGIEYHAELVSASDLKIADAQRFGEIQKDRICRVVQGSYYPPDYIRLRAQGQAVALHHEDRFFDGITSDELSCFSFPRKTRARVFYPIASDHDPFAALGIAWHDVSVFFSYTWGVEFPSQLEIFSRYAAPGAVFLNETAAEPEKHEDLLEALGLQQKSLGVSLYRYRSSVKTTSGLMLYRKK